jgi:hypothetical protein
VGGDHPVPERHRPRQLDLAVVTLLRGRRGTEYAVGNHVNNEICTWLSPTSSLFMQASSSELNLERFYRAVSINTPFELAVVNASHIRQHPAALHRCSYQGRAGRKQQPDDYLEAPHADRGHWADYMDVPLGEASENYEVDILNAAKTAVLRTLTSTTPSVVYTAPSRTPILARRPHR